MKRAGHRVVVFAPDNDPEAAATLKGWGVEFLRVRLQRTGMNPLRDCAFLLAFTNLLRRTRPDVFFACNIKSVIYGLLAARLVRVPRRYALITGLGYAFMGAGARQWTANRVARRLYRYALPHADAVFFQNPDDLNLFAELGLLRDRNQAVQVNGSGVDLAHFAEAPPPNDRVVFLLVGRLLRDKGIVEYVEAARLLKRRYPETVFQIVGGLDTNPSAIEPGQMERWRDEGIIDFQGAAADVRPFLVRASVFVLPSYREGTPVAVLEAMSVGRPIVTTDVPGCRETVIEGENGFLVPVKDPTSLAQAMERFIRQPELVADMGRRSRRIAVEKFDVNKVNNLMMATMGLSLAPVTLPVES
jgi:glycosyltransferase involved in cell wall biosynthesis